MNLSNGERKRAIYYNQEELTVNVLPELSGLITFSQEYQIFKSRFRIYLFEQRSHLLLHNLTEREKIRTVKGNKSYHE